MRMFATYFGNRLATCFDTRKKAEAYPGPRGMECAFRLIVEMASAQWDDADAFKPDHSDPVLLYRLYKAKREGHPDGFQSYGEWKNGQWYDLVFRCFVDDVQCWHELPTLPTSGRDLKAIDDQLRDSLRGEGSGKPVAAARPKPDFRSAALQLYSALNVLRNYIGVPVGTFLSKESADSMGRHAAEACSAYHAAEAVADYEATKER